MPLTKMENFRSGAGWGKGILLPGPFPSVPPSPPSILHNYLFTLKSTLQSNIQDTSWSGPSLCLPPAVFLTTHPIPTHNISQVKSLYGSCYPIWLTVCCLPASIHPATTAWIVCPTVTVHTSSSVGPSFLCAFLYGPPRYNNHCPPPFHEPGMGLPYLNTGTHLDP